MSGAGDDLRASKELVRQHIELSWNAAEFDRLDEVWAADAVVHLSDGHSLVGLEALKEHLRSVVLLWEDRHCEIEDLVCEGDTVANRWSFRGTGRGERLTISGMDFYRVADGLLVEEWIALGTPSSSTES